MRPLLATFVFAAALLFMATVAVAGSFSVNPVGLEMQHAQRSTSLVVTNHGSSATLLQVSVLRWRRVAGVDEMLTAGSDEAPVITPPLFRLASGGASQVIRIGFIKPSASESEEQWRVVVEEVPQLADAAAEPTAGMGIAMRLRVSLPLLRRPVNIQQNLQWQASLADGTVQLAARNDGSVTERLDEVVLTGGATPLRLAGPLYVFPGEQRLLSLKTNNAALPQRLQLRVAGTPQQVARELEVRAQ